MECVAERRKINEGLKEHYAEVFCKHAEMEVELIENGFSWEDELFESSRGLSLGSRTLVPPELILQDRSVGVIYCHGYGDHLRWKSVNKLIKYAQEGFLVTGLELEGHGISEQQLGLIYDVHETVNDLYEFIKQQQERYSLNKWFIHGESMGGMIALLMSRKAKEMGDVEIDGLVLACPMCKMSETIKPPGFLVSGLLALSKLLPTWGIVPSGIHIDLIYKNSEFKEKVLKDPLMYCGRPKMATAATMYTATVDMEKNLDKITTPFFVIHGKKDLVTSYEGSVQLYEQSGVAEGDKEILLPEEAWHGLLNGESEEDMESYWRSIFRWIESRLDKE